MSQGVLTAVRAAVAAGKEADEILRATVGALASEPGIAWAGIAFVEGDGLALGPAAGTPDEERRRRAAVRYRGTIVAELWVDGEFDSRLVDELAELVAEQCLVGWDTGGLPWGEQA